MEDGFDRHGKELAQVVNIDINLIIVAEIIFLIELARFVEADFEIVVSDFGDDFLDDIHLDLGGLFVDDDVDDGIVTAAELFDQGFFHRFLQSDQNAFFRNAFLGFQLVEGFKKLCCVNHSVFLLKFDG